MKEVNGVFIYEESDFVDWDPELKPYKVPFHSDKIYMVWTGGRKFNVEHAQKYGSSLGPEDRDETGVIQAQSILEGKHSADMCSLCNKPHYQKNWAPGDHLRYILKHNVCFHCAHWEMHIEHPTPVIIDGTMYTPGGATTGGFRGMGGRRFDIEFTSGLYVGQKITTFDLWSGGTMPQYWREKIPDNAKFLNGAERVDLPHVETSTCWEGSNTKAEPYPQFKTLKLSDPHG